MKDSSLNVAGAMFWVQTSSIQVINTVSRALAWLKAADRLRCTFAVPYGVKGGLVVMLLTWYHHTADVYYVLFVTV